MCVCVCDDRQLKNIQLCKDLQKNLSARALPEISQFSLSQQVTYNYYLGRLALIDNKFTLVCSMHMFVLGHMVS
jgi:hypothetical protein